MRHLFDVRMHDANRKHLILQKEAEEEVEVNLSDEGDLIMTLISHDAYDPGLHYVYLSPLLRRKIAEIISDTDNDFYSISLFTDYEGHKVRGKRSDIARLFSMLREKLSGD